MSVPPRSSQDAAPPSNPPRREYCDTPPATPSVRSALPLLPPSVVPELHCTPMYWFVPDDVGPSVFGVVKPRTLPWETFLRSPFGWWISTTAVRAGMGFGSQPAKNAPGGGVPFSRRKRTSETALLRMYVAPLKSGRNELLSTPLLHDVDW